MIGSRRGGAIQRRRDREPEKIMDRRELLQWSVAAATAASLVKPAVAQPAPPGKSGLLVCSRNLQWLRTPQEVAKACIDIGLDHLDLSVQAYPGHVDPAKAKTDLPAFVNGLKQAGVAVTCITTPIVDADTPNAEAILDAAASSGITQYSWGGFTYDTAKPYPAQLDALKPRIQKLAKLNEKYKVKAMYRPRAGAGNVGAAFFDILDLLKNFDPRFFAIQYDTAALLQPVRDVFVMHMRLGAPYIGGMVLNDAALTLDLPTYDQGFYTGTGPIRSTNAGDNTGGDGGNPLAIGGGGRPLPYHFHPMRVGTGMIDLILIARTLKEIGFNGPMETDAAWPLGGAENGADKNSLARQAVIGQLKRERLTIEAGFFAGGWNIDIARPAFQVGGAPAGRGGRGGVAP